MSEVVVKSIGEKPVIVELPEQPLTVIVHQQGMKVDVPGAVELNGRNTLDCVEKLNQREWEHISTGPLFKMLFHSVFPEDGNTGVTGPHPLVIIPKDVEELKQDDFGIQHVCGLIILSCEAMFKSIDTGVPVKIFVREIETHLHPSTQQRIMNIPKLLLGDKPN